jgi:hypothetical protein
LYTTKKVSKKEYLVLKRQRLIVLRISRKGISILNKLYNVLVKEDIVIALKVL